MSLRVRDKVSYSIFRMPTAGQTFWEQTYVALNLLGLNFSAKESKEINLYKLTQISLYMKKI